MSGTMPRAAQSSDDLEADRPLPGDDVRVVEGMDEGAADLLHDAGDHRVAIFGRAVIGDDARAAPLGAHSLRRPARRTA